MKLRKILSLSLSFILFTTITFSQNIKNFTNIYDIKGINNIYKIGEEKLGYSIWNSKNTYKDIVPQYMYNEVIPHIDITNKDRLDNLIVQYFKSYFIKYDTFSYPYLYIYLYSDICGNIKEIYIRYPRTIGVIPGLIIEQFETALLNSNVKVVFDKNNSVFRGSEWIGKPVIYKSEDLKNM